MRQYGAQVEIVVMDMNPAFKAAVRKALDRPLIIADRFNYSRYIHWALDEVRRKVQREFNSYDRKNLKQNAYGFRKYEHYKAKVLLTRVYRNIGCHLG